ncbi:predicted protein [Sclerotinia sclerotiorum 1980 UF-70]|uniref:Uncharacterized protein n=1 Tax=Sclerotinia sclerotiorum (strain ATCC 18683 / 1980 / Ss-1) TaxID=665079 RepID=A7EI56_SCLS1|nr:predicted protein [Sclerotinia sclerotiorum 1980 UF-70]EDO02522.1 predicted protein [Sclerotinia sclerotiorum 1980 UF-70]
MSLTSTFPMIQYQSTSSNFASSSTSLQDLIYYYPTYLDTPYPTSTANNFHPPPPLTKPIGTGTHPNNLRQDW